MYSRLNKQYIILHDSLKELIWDQWITPTFGEICSHFLPQCDVAVEDDALLKHANALQTFCTGKPPDVIIALQNMIHSGGPETVLGFFILKFDPIQNCALMHRTSHLSQQW